jgi:hypothetical protein
MKRSFIVFMILILSIFSASLSFGETAPKAFEIDSANIKVSFPDGWETEQNKEDNSITASPDENLVIILDTLSAVDDMKAALKIYQKEISSIFKSPKVEEESDDEVNGMKTHYIVLSGKYEGKSSSAEIYLIDTDKAIAMLLIIGTKAAIKKYDADLNDIYNSLEKAE